MLDAWGSFFIVIILMMILVFAVSTTETMTITGDIHNIVNGYSRIIEQKGGMTPQIYNDMMADLNDISNKIVSVIITCPTNVPHGQRIDVEVTILFNRNTYNGNTFSNVVHTKVVKTHFTSEVGRYP